MIVYSIALLSNSVLQGDVCRVYNLVNDYYLHARALPKKNLKQHSVKLKFNEAAEM